MTGNGAISPVKYTHDRQGKRNAGNAIRDSKIRSGKCKTLPAKE